MRNRWIPLIILALSWASSSVQGASYDTYGPRAAGMGGAFVALAEGAGAVLVNPAGLYLEPDWDVSLVYEGGTAQAENVEDLIQLARTFDPTDPEVYGNQEEADELDDVLRRIQREGFGSGERRGSMLTIISSRGALSVIQRESWQVIPDVDREHGQALPSGEEGSVADNESRLALTHLEVTEISMAYGYANEKGFAVGMATRYLDLDTHATFLGLWDEAAGRSLERLRDAADDGPTRSDRVVSMDIGLLWQTRNGRMALVGRDLFRPKFQSPTGKVRLEEQLRFGYAWLPAQTFVATFDTDILRWRDPWTDSEERTTALGLEKWFINRKLATRFGVSRNYALVDADPVYSAGLGLAFTHFTADAAGWRDSSGNTEGLSFQVSVLF